MRESLERIVERGQDGESLIEAETPDTHIYPPKGSRRTTHPRIHLVAVAGLLVTGAFVIYATAVHMGYMGSDEAGAALDQTTLTQTSLNQTSLNQTSLDEPSLNQTSLDQTSLNQTSLDQTSLDQTSLDQTSLDQTSLDQTSLNQTSFNQTSLDQTSQRLNATRDIDDAVAPISSAGGANASAAGVGEFTVAGPVAGPVGAPAGLLETAPSPAPDSGRVYYQNESETWHSMSDEELLRKATSGEREREQERGDRRKLAFLFMARGPLPLAPLWERYFRGYEQMYSVYVHAHPNFVPTFASSSPFFRRFVPSKAVLWGQMSGYEAERRLLGNALLDPTNVWFLLLSESCIPIVNFPETFAYFNNSPNVSFIESFQDSTQVGRGRLYRGRFEAMAPEITATNFRKGSQWFHITRPLALLAARDSPQYSKFQAHFCAIHAVCFMDEHFLPTLAWIRHPHALLAFRTLTFYNFPPKSSHPFKFHASDLDGATILSFREGQNCTYNGQVTSSCFLFARKVDPDALGVLLALAAPVMGIPT